MQKRPIIIIIGGGGHTRVLIGMLLRESHDIRGIVTRDAALVGTRMLGVPVLGLEEEVRFGADEVTLVNGVGNIATRAGSGLEVRARIHRHYHGLGYAFLPVLSEHAVIQPEVTMGDGVQVMPGAVIQPGAMIGENVIVNTRASIDHDVVISPHAHIAPGAVLCGHAVIGEETHVGAGAVVIQGVRIGSHVVIGAGAVVTRDVPDNAIVRAAAMKLVKAE
jgi:UDP-perosamine 4-acetyltransferase